MKEILDLGHQPICNSIVSKDDLNEPEITFPLRLAFCSNCYLVQLSSLIPQGKVFSKEFNYLTNQNQTLVRHFESVAASLAASLRLQSSDLVCDIGSNDGSLLLAFKRRGTRVIGVEPTPLPAREAIEKGIPTIQEFFGKSTARKIRDKLGKVRVVTAMNVLAHADDVHSFLDGIADMMEKGHTVFATQSHYLPSLIKKIEYDTIYHEHPRYYTLTTLKHLLEMHGIHIFDVEFNSIHGGSILVYASREKRPVRSIVSRTLASEKPYSNIRTYKEFAERVRESRWRLVRLLYGLRMKGEKIVGIGAPMKATTLLNFCNIGPDVLEFVTEVNPLKIGRYVPGVHIPIIDEARLFSEKTDYALLLSWTLQEQIISNLRSKGYKGKFIIPVPSAKIIN